MMYKPYLYNLQTRQKNRKSYWELKLTLLNISILKTSNINTGHKSMMVSNKGHNLPNRTVQFTGQKKAWISTIEIVKGLKYKLSFWTFLKSKTNWNVEMLEPWDWTFHMTLLKTLKYTPCLSFWASPKTIVEIYWLDSHNLLT